MKIALILEGGGMRGVYTAGILDFFLDKKIEFLDCYAVSAGTCCGINYKSKQTGRSISMNVVFSKDPRYLGLKTYIKNRSFFGLDFIFDVVAEKYMRFDFETFKNNPMNLYSVATNIETGKPEYFNLKDLKTSDMELAKSSCAIPLLSKIREMDGYKLLDGGVADPIPFEKAFIDGFDKVVVITTRNKGFRLKERKRNLVISKFYKDYPNFLETAEKHNLEYNKTLEKLMEYEEEKKAFTFYPSKPLKMDKLETNKDKLFDLYNNGYEDAFLLYKDLIEFVKDAENVKYEK